MKSFIIAFVLLATTTSFAAESSLIIRGEKAKAMIAAMVALTDGGNTKVEGLEVVSGSSQEGGQNEDVVDQWQTADGQIGDQKYECESHTYMKYRLAKKDSSQYTDYSACRKIVAAPKAVAN